MFTELFIIGIVFAVIGMLVSARLKSKFSKYSKVSLRNGLTGKEIAEKMLRDNGISDVSVIQVDGKLTDHYNPLNKTVNLSYDVYHGANAASAAVAAHECGHAVQHAKAYSMLMLRSKLVPLVNLSGTIINFVFIGSIFLGSVAGGIFNTQMLLSVLLVAYGSMMVFSLITLPVEFDASNRALAWMRDNGVVIQGEYDGAKDALKWAAMTYVVAALSSIAAFLFILLRFLGSNDR